MSGRKHSQAQEVQRNSMSSCGLSVPLTRRSTVEIERTPQLKMGWPNQAIKQDLLQNNLAIVFGFVARATEQQFAVYNRYLGVLVLMAKNDMFFQFELNLVVDFSECFEMALRAYGDWDGEPNTFDGVVAGLCEKLTDGG